MALNSGNQTHKRPGAQAGERNISGADAGQAQAAGTPCRQPDGAGGRETPMTAKGGAGDVAKSANRIAADEQAGPGPWPGGANDNAAKETAAKETAAKETAAKARAAVAATAGLAISESARPETAKSNGKPVPEAKLARGWTRISERLRAELGDDLYTSWFARIEPVEFGDGLLVISVPTKFLSTWLKSHYGEKLLGYWDKELKGVRRLEIRVRSRGEPVRLKEQPVAEAPRGGLTMAPGAGVAAVAVPGQAGDGDVAGSPLGHNMTFENFVVGRSNALAHAAAVRVADAGPGTPVHFNPLYIHSPSGLGKSHLLHAIAWRIRNQAPQRRVVYLTAERFMYRFFAAAKARDILSFKDYFQGVDVLLIDDFQFLQGKSTQEFCHTFNSLVDSRRQVIIAADLPPLQLDSIDDRMRSRLAGGLVVDIEPAEYELRRSILNARLAEAKARAPGLDIPPTVLEFIAHRIHGGGRELEGALTRVIAHYELGQGDLSPDVISGCLRDLLHTGDLKRIKIDDILRVIGKHYNVSRSDLLSARRARSIVRPRQVGMFLAKRLTTRSLPEIGRRFGGRDHSTVLHAIRKVQELMDRDEKLTREVELLVRLLEN